MCSEEGVRVLRYKEEGVVESVEFLVLLSPAPLLLLGVVRKEEGVIDIVELRIPSPWSSNLPLLLVLLLVLLLLGVVNDKEEEVGVDACVVDKWGITRWGSAK